MEHARLRDRLWPRATARASIRAGAWAASICFAAVMVADCPGRWATARHQTQYGYPLFDFFVAGVCRDTPRLVLIVGGLVVFACLVARRWLQRIPVVIGAIAVFVVAFASSAFAEFKIQRGLHPTLLDLRAGAGDVGFVTSSLRTVFLARHLYPLLAAIAVLGGIGFVLWRRRSQTAPAPLPYVVGWLLVGCLFYLVPMGVIDPSLRLLRLPDRRIAGAPFESFFTSLGDATEHVKLGVLGVVERAQVSPDQYPGGEALLGLPPRAASAQQPLCQRRPFGRTFWFDGGERSLEAPTLVPPPTPAQPLLDALRALSVEMFRDRPRQPLDVWQVMLESFRADDIHALNAAAPRSIAPVINSLYEARGGAMASRHAWEAGQRTSEALSATTCGLGTLPYALSFSRDLGLLPFRCVFDVVSDAGLEPSFFYGARTSFDNMDEYLRYHGVRDIVAEWQLPRGLPRTWGVTDLAVIDHALTSAEGASGAHYRTLLTISNHLPYTVPEDTPQEVLDRVEAALRDTPNQAESDDRDRLLTFSYTDAAVGRFTDRLSRSPLAARSIVVLCADHSVGDHYVWGRQDPDGVEASKAQIPLVLWLPDAFVQKSREPDRVRELVRRVQALLETTVLSQNDVPMLLLTLISASPEIASLPLEWRWHNFGGQVTSPWFRFTPRPKTVQVYGLNGSAELFYRTADDRPERPARPSDHIEKPEDVLLLDTELLPATALLARLLPEFARPCRDRARLRMRQ
jgi:hypothetical protein